MYRAICVTRFNQTVKFSTKFIQHRQILLKCSQFANPLISTTNLYHQLSIPQNFNILNSKFNFITHQSSNDFSALTSKEFDLKPYVAQPHSYAFGRSRNELEYRTIGELLDQRVESDSNQIALISHHENIKKTFSQFNEDVNRIANAMLNQLGLQHGDVVGLWSANSYNWITIQYACARLGVILCTINPFYQAQELEYVLRKGDVKALFLPGKGSSQEIINKFSNIFQETIYKSSENYQDNLKLQHIISIDGETYTDGVTHKFKAYSLDKLTKNASNNLTSSAPSNISPDDPAIIMFTSGTTGKPKGACLSQFTMVNNARLAMLSNSVVSGQSVMCVPLPFFHSFAGVIGNIGLSALPVQTVIPYTKHNAPQLVESIKANQVTHMLATPTLIIDMLNYIRNNNIQLPTLQTVMAGGATTPVDIAHQFMKAVPSCTNFRIAYGATELGPCATTCKSDDSFEHRTETIGAPLDFVEIKIVDPQTKGMVKLGECGEIYSRGHNTMLGYWKDPEKTSEAIDHAGWYNTGDLGVMDSNGYLKIIGRTKELIIVGGENVYPREIEEILHTHPSIFDVHVIGVPDPRKGEEVCAFVKLTETTEVNDHELKQFCQDKMAYFKIPKYFLFVDSFQVTSTGKAQKFIMRQIACVQLNLKDN